MQRHEQLWLEENWYSSSCDWLTVLLSFAAFYPIKTSQSCDAEEVREDGWTQIALCLTFSTRMQLLLSTAASRGGLWLLVFTMFGSVSCFGSNLDSEFTFLLPAGRSECFFQTAIKNGTMEVEYQVTAKVVRKQTLALSLVTFDMVVRLTLCAQSAFYGRLLVPYLVFCVLQWRIAWTRSPPSSESKNIQTGWSHNKVDVWTRSFTFASHFVIKPSSVCVGVWVGGGRIRNYCKNDLNETLC